MSTPSSQQICADFYAAQHASSPKPPARATGGCATSAATAMDVCTRAVVTCDAGMPVSEAARKMRKHGVGSLVVVDDGSPGQHVVTGMLTDRDLAIGVVAAERDTQAFRVGDIMSRDVVTARADDSVTSIVALMRHKRVRRIPVTGPEGVLVGIVTLDDLLAGSSIAAGAVAGIVGRPGMPTEPGEPAGTQARPRA